MRRECSRLILRVALPSLGAQPLPANDSLDSSPFRFFLARAPNLHSPEYLVQPFAICFLRVIHEFSVV